MKINLLVTSEKLPYFLFSHCALFKTMHYSFEDFRQNLGEQVDESSLSPIDRITRKAFRQPILLSELVGCV